MKVMLCLACARKPISQWFCCIRTFRGGWKCMNVIFLGQWKWKELFPRSASIHKLGLCFLMRNCDCNAPILVDDNSFWKTASISSINAGLGNCMCFGGQNRWRANRWRLRVGEFDPGCPIWSELPNPSAPPQVLKWNLNMALSGGNGLNLLKIDVRPL